MRETRLTAAAEAARLAAGSVSIILAAPARLAALDAGSVIVATTNVRHLTRVVPAAHWWEL